MTRQATLFFSALVWSHWVCEGLPTLLLRGVCCSWVYATVGSLFCCVGDDVIAVVGPGNRGFGTVRYSTPEDANEAVEVMNNREIGGRTVTVRIDRFA